MCRAGAYAAPIYAVSGRVPGIHGRCIRLLQQISLEGAGRARTCLSLGSSEARAQHGEPSSTENRPPPRRRTLHAWITAACVVRGRVLPAPPWHGSSRLTAGGRRRGRAGEAEHGTPGFRPPRLWRREGIAAGVSGTRCRDGVSAAAHRAALVAGGAGAGLQPGAHDAAGHQHLPGGHRAQVRTVLGERGRALPTRLRCPAPPGDRSLPPAREAATSLLPNPLLGLKKRKEIVQALNFRS